MAKSMKQICIENIARENGIETLETRKSDSLDFHDIAVWQLQTMLDEAFKMGRQTANVEVE